MRRHDALRDILFDILKQCGIFVTVVKEQIIPLAAPSLTAPRLDVVASGGPGGDLLLDVTVATPSAPAGLRAGAASQSGVAARVLETVKRRKYPGASVTPFAVEAYGRLGESALSVLRALARKLPQDERGPYLAKIHQTLSATLQRHNARNVILAQA